MGGEAPGMSLATEILLGPTGEEAMSLLSGTRCFLPWDGGDGEEGGREAESHSHHTGMSLVLPGPCVLPYMLGLLHVMNHLPHM